MVKTFTCIICPRGCAITVSADKIRVDGYKCARGLAYVNEEISDPKRTVTGVVATDSASIPYVPFRTEKPISKKLVYELLKELYEMKICVPVKCGNPILTNYRGTGVDVRITRTVNN